MFADIAVNVAGVQNTFHYSIPAGLAGALQPGSLVTAPFGAQRVQGIVVGFTDEPAVPELKPVEALLDEEPALNRAQLDLAYWLAHTYLAPLNECLNLMLPPGLSKRADVIYRLLEDGPEPQTPAQEALAALLARRGPLRGRQIDRALPHVNWRGAADWLARHGRLAKQPVLDPPSVRAKQVWAARLAPAGADYLAGGVGPDPLPSRPPARLARLRAVLGFVRAEGGGLVEAARIFAETGANRNDLRLLAEAGLLDLADKEIIRDPLADVDYVPADPPELTEEQQRAWEVIERALGVRDYAGETPGPQSLTPNPYLLHGVTGSGKTEIYLRAVARVLAEGGRALVLVPEIALTPQTIQRFLARFPGRVTVVHSQLSAGERYDTWRRARAGAVDVVVGARSALFTPLPNLGLIVLDEEHDEAYRQDVSMPVAYHARETAVEYARRLGALCLLGSATPDVVTYYRAERGQYALLDLPQRVLGHSRRIAGQAQRLGVADPAYRRAGLAGQALAADMPQVTIVDMRQELRAGNTSMFSRGLRAGLAEALARGEQAILFLNRRGRATYIFCRDCGYVLACPRCDAPLTQHVPGAELICHRCNYRRRAPAACPQCGGNRIREFGAGTQRVAEAVAEQFPQARVLRWDADTTRAKGAHAAILGRFAAREADVLIGTQMIAKGLDLPLVTLVGVISADTGLALPDYRSAERTFQVLTQVVGRAGRGLRGGRAFVQTYHPDHYAVRAAAAHDFAAFYRAELAHRREYGYPPFGRLVRLLYRSPRAAEAEKQAQTMAALLRRRIEEEERSATSLIGPAPCFMDKIAGEYRWQIVLRGPAPASLVERQLPPGWRVEVDPLNLL